MLTCCWCSTSADVKGTRITKTLPRSGHRGRRGPGRGHDRGSCSRRSQCHRRGQLHLQGRQSENLSALLPVTLRLVHACALLRVIRVSLLASVLRITAVRRHWCLRLSEGNDIVPHVFHFVESPLTTSFLCKTLYHASSFSRGSCSRCRVLIG